MSARPKSSAHATASRGERTNRLALRREDASAALGISDESFDKFVRPSLPVVRIGSLRLYPVEALEAWLREHAHAPIDELER